MTIEHLLVIAVVAAIYLINMATRRPPRPRDPRRPAPPLAPRGMWPLDPSAPRPIIAPPAGPPPSDKRLDLDAAQFAPISDAAAKRAAAGMGSLFASSFFGRRDLIPPASDPRTLLIDRALVGHGYLTPEQLVEIHEVGAQMDEARPDMALASARAEEAVRRTKEERAALKERKKAEAAEKRRRRAEDVARRKATDIIFLGRGVSAGLADRRANVERRQGAGLPVLATPADVAAALGLAIPRLRFLAFHSEAAKRVHYVRFTVPKKSGGARELAAPHRDLKRCQDWIRAAILERVAPKDAAHGFVRGRSTVTNAAPHVGRPIVVNADLRDFFPSVTFPRVKGIFEGLGYSPAAATVLGLLATEAPRRTVEYAGETLHVASGPRALPQGAPTSPALSNLAVRALDARLAALVRKIGWTYTRYADDLTFSADAGAAAKTGYLLARLRHFAEEEGFRVNEKKTRVQRPNRRQTVTGIVVNRRPGVPRRLVRRLRAILHRARSEGLAAQNRRGEPNFEAWLHGTIAYVSMVSPEQARPLVEALDALG